MDSEVPVKPAMITRFRQFVGKWVLFAFALLLFVVVMKVKEFSDFHRILANLKADSRIAEVLVTESKLDEITGLFATPTKFPE